MANYFPVALTGTTRSWLMNLLEGTLHSWSELCHQFTANFESAYARPGNETDLHAIQQRLTESLCSFVQRFSQIYNTIPRISNASVVVAFYQGVRDEKMLEKLTTHDVQDVSLLFSLAASAPRLRRATPGTPQPPRQQRGRASPTPGPRPKAAATATTITRRRLAAPSRWPGRPLPFPRAIGGYRFLYVTIDKFTKWPEATQWSKSTSNPQ
jgi:hypothetical protein